MSWTLRRYRLGETVTDGQLIIPDHGISITTLERPWLPGMRGGMPFASCVPDGIYQLSRHTRPNGDLVLALRNPDLGVYYQQGEVPDEGGRYLILIHVGNWVHDVVGCIAPGLRRQIDSQGRPMVTNSGKAMTMIMDAFDDEHPRRSPIVDGQLHIMTTPAAYN